MESDFDVNFSGINDLRPDLPSWARPGLFLARLDPHELFVSHGTEPADIYDPADPNYDWTQLDNLLAAAASRECAAIPRLHFGKGAPAYLINNGGAYYATTGANHEHVDYAHPNGQDFVKGLTTAIQARYGTNDHFYGVAWTEGPKGPRTSTNDSSPAWGVNSHSGQDDTTAAFIQLYRDCHDILTTSGLVLFQPSTEKTEGTNDLRGIIYAHADPDIFKNGSCHQGGILAGVLDAFGYYGNIQEYSDSGSGHLGTEGVPHPTMMSAEPNGYDKQIEWPTDSSSPVFPSGPGYSAGEVHDPTEVDEWVWYHSVLLPVNMLVLANATSNQTPAAYKAAFEKYGYGPNQDSTWGSILLPAMQGTTDGGGSDPDNYTSSFTIGESATKASVDSSLRLVLAAMKDGVDADRVIAPENDSVAIPFVTGSRFESTSTSNDATVEAYATTIATGGTGLVTLNPQGGSLAQGRVGIVDFPGMSLVTVLGGDERDGNDSSDLTVSFTPTRDAQVFAIHALMNDGATFTWSGTNSVIHADNTNGMTVEIAYAGLITAGTQRDITAGISDGNGRGALLVVGLEESSVPGETLVVDDSTLSFVSDNVDLTQGTELEVQNSALSFTADNVTLSQAYNLDVQNSSFNMTADNIELFPLIWRIQLTISGGWVDQ